MSVYFVVIYYVLLCLIIYKQSVIYFPWFFGTQDLLKTYIIVCLLWLFFISFVFLCDALTYNDNPYEVTSLLICSTDQSDEPFKS
jgi:hypothetical protein